MMKNSFTFRLLLLTSAILLVGTLSMNAGNVYTLNSPNGKIKVEIGTDKHLSYLQSKYYPIFPRDLSDKLSIRENVTK